MNNRPKIIHYIWVGHNPKPEIVIRCIQSWEKYMPDYKIIEWNETNFDVYKNEYIREAYQKEKWAFVSDYMRFDILYTYGGIYFDTDVELLKPIPEGILENTTFTGMESTGFIAPGLVFACEKGNAIAKYMRNLYLESQFDIDNIITVNQIITSYLEEKGFEKKNCFQMVDGIAIYPPEIFCGFDQDIREIAINDKTISIHHYAGTWTAPNHKREMQKVLKKVLGIEGYRRVLSLIRKIRALKGD